MYYLLKTPNLIKIASIYSPLFFKVWYNYPSGMNVLHRV